MRKFGYLGSGWGMNIIRSPYVPKKKIPIHPKTDDMREMVEVLQQNGVATEQYNEVYQVFISDGRIVGRPSVIAGMLTNVT